MKSIDLTNVHTLIGDIDEMVCQLTRHRILEVHQQISQSYYMQKVAELRLLLEQLQEAELRVEIILDRISAQYHCIHPTVQTDIRWLKDYIGKRSGN